MTKISKQTQVKIHTNYKTYTRFKVINRVMYLIRLRDFNVHCGVLNFGLPNFIKKIFKISNLNEIFADY